MHKVHCNDCSNLHIIPCNDVSTNAHSALLFASTHTQMHKVRYESFDKCTKYVVMMIQ